MSPIVDFRIPRDVQGVLGMETPVFMTGGVYGEIQTAGAGPDVVANYEITGDGVALGLVSLSGTTAGGNDGCWFFTSNLIVVYTVAGVPTIVFPSLPLTPFMSNGALAVATLDIVIVGTRLDFTVTPGIAAPAKWVLAGMFQEADQ